VSSNGQGITALLALRLLEGFDLKGQDPMGPERWHLLIEVMRNRLRRRPLVRRGSRLLEGPRRGAALEALRRSPPGALRSEARLGRPAEGLAFGGVRHRLLLRRDGRGNACSFHQLQLYGVRDGHRAGALRFSLQNRGANFVLDPAHPNGLQPRKRPYHTIIPGMLTRADGSLLAPFGVMGGFMQPQGHVQVVVGLLDDGLDPQPVVERPRFCVQPVDGAESRVNLEAGVPDATVAALQALGHPLLPGISGYSRALFGRGQVIRRSPEGTLSGAAIPGRTGE